MIPEALDWDNMIALSAEQKYLICRQGPFQGPAAELPKLRCHMMITVPVIHLNNDIEGQLECAILWHTMN